MRAEELKTIVVIGAGIMGQQIAMNTAIKGRASGYQVILCDSFPAAVEKAQAWADQVLSRPRCQGPPDPGAGGRRQGESHHHR